MAAGAVTTAPRPTPAKGSAGARRLAWTVALFPVTVAIAFVILWLRRPEAIRAPQLWAEDGTVFYAAYLVDGPIRSLLEAYGGFLAVVPRLIIAIVGSAPAAALPGLVSNISLIGSALSCAFFALPEYRYLLRSDQVRIVCCIAFAAVPYAPQEVANLNGFAWYLCIPAMLLLALPRITYNRRPLWFTLGAAALVALATLSTPALIVFVPLALFKAYKGPSRMRIVSIPCLLAVIAQLLVFRVSGLSASEPLPGGALAVGIVDAFGYRVEWANVVGRFVGADASPGHALWLAMLAIAVALSGTAWYLATRKGASMTQRYVYILCAAFASVTLMFFDPSVQSDVAAVGRWGEWAGERFFLVPSALFFFGAARLEDDILRPLVREPFRALAFVALVACAGVSNFTLPSLADEHWTSRAGLIDAWRAARDGGRTHSALDLPIDPSGWTIALPAFQATP